jgi:fructose-bisphosphate aldolase class I
MILPGSKSEKKISSDEIAELTLKCLIENVPSEVPGIAFLSGGQTEIEATKNLNAINKQNKSSFIITYSYGRALQQSALKHWSNNTSDINGTQRIFDHRANMCSLAARGKWTEQLEQI